MGLYGIKTERGRQAERHANIEIALEITGTWADRQMGRGGGESKKVDRDTAVPSSKSGCRWFCRGVPHRAPQLNIQGLSSRYLCNDRFKS